MSLWRREAIEHFPELHRQIADASSLMEAWWPLWDKFAMAYRMQPADNEAIAAVYDYAAWCLKHRSIEVRTSAVLNFYERLHDDLFVRRDMPRWISQQDFNLLNFAWTYNTKQPFADLRREFMENKVRIEQEKERHSAPFTGSRSKR